MSDRLYAVCFSALVGSEDDALALSAQLAALALPSSHVTRSVQVIDPVAFKDLLAVVASSVKVDGNVIAVEDGG